MNEKICYKVVKKSISPEKACIWGYFSVHAKAKLRATYKIGVKTTAPVGKLFAFCDLESAQNFAEEGGPSQEVLKCIYEGKNIEPLERLPTDMLTFNLAKKFWNNS